MAQAFSPSIISLKSIVIQAPNTVTLNLDAWFPFKPGQAVQLAFPGDTKPRFYSICSSPTETGFVSVTVKWPANHVLGTILPGLKAGDPIGVQGPFGSFGLPEPLEGPLCFLAAGSGITPIRSMLKYAQDKRIQAEKWLFYSVRTPADELFGSEFEAWERSDHSFHRIVTLTGGADDGEWRGERGRLSERLLRKYWPDSHGHFFLCGPPAFVTDMEHLLSGPLNVPPARIRREQW
ncbi:MAG TPA: FAD-dependent oxidoreductase [Elusimicrobiota bacterium]|nr:FAD-dependent oxidoreductase [Elusimicrobiota bacterium]